MARDITGKIWKFDAINQGEGKANNGSYLRLSTFTTTNATNHIDLTAHGFYTGQGPIRVEEGNSDLPSGYAEDTDYWVIKVDADNFKLATTYANAIAGTAVALADDGTTPNYLIQLPVFDIPIFVKYITIDAGAAGGSFEVTESSGGRTLTGALTVAANAHDQIVINDFVPGVYMTTMTDGQILVAHGRH